MLLISAPNVLYNNGHQIAYIMLHRYIKYDVWSTSYFAQEHKQVSIVCGCKDIYIKYITSPLKPKISKPADLFTWQGGLNVYRDQIMEGHRSSPC